MNHHKVLLILSLIIICLIFIQCTSSDVKHNDRKLVKTALVDDDSSNLINKGENLGHRSRRSSKPSKSILKNSAKATKVINSKKSPETPDILLINVQKAHAVILKTAEDVKNFIASFKNDIHVDGNKLRNTSIRRGLLLYLHSLNTSKKEYSNTTTRLLNLANNSGLIENPDSVNFDTVKAAVTFVIKSIEKVKNVAQNGHKIVTMLFQSFIIPTSIVKKRKADETETQAELPFSVPSAPSMTIYKPSPKKLKTDCGKCVNRRTSIESLVSCKRQLKNNLDDVLLSANKHRSLKQSLKRKEDIEQKLRTKIRELNKNLAQKDSEISRLKRTITETSMTRIVKKKRHKCKYSRKVDELRRGVSEMQKRCKQLELENESLRAIVEEEDVTPGDPVSVKKDLKTYSSRYRKAAYACLLHQVPIQEISHVIEEVVEEVTGLKVDAKANPTTIAQFAFELGVLNDIQVCEAVMENDNLTIGMDATSLSGEHINEVHLMFPGNPPWGLELQLNALAGGKTEDYVKHVTEALHDIGDSFALFHEKASPEVKNAITSKIKNTISDRVSVNHCVFQQLQEDLNIHLLEMNCNVHPLDGVASAARSTLKRIDSANGLKGQCFGKTCCGDNLVYAISKMRFKQGSGDPKGFKMFLKKNGIPASMLIRYVGNRLHVIFHLSGVLFSLQPILMEYFKTVCNNTSSLRTAIIHDFSHPSILLQLKALGLLGKTLTGPWMTVFYGNKEGKSNLEVVPELKTAVANLRRFSNFPLSILSAESDMFGKKLDLSSDNVLKSLQNPVDDLEKKEFEEVMKELIVGTIKLLERQLAKYLTGDLSAPTPQLIAQTKSTPIDNIFSERVLGMADAQTRRAPNATPGFIDAKVKCSSNKTLQWLKKKDPGQQERLISFAIKRGRDVRTLRKEREKCKNKIFMKRQDVKRQQRDEAYRRKIGKPLKELVLSSPIDELELDEKLKALEVADDNKFKVIKEVFSNKDCLVGKYIEQYWFLDDQDVLYCGKVLYLKTPKSGPYYKVSYWLESEKEEDGVDSHVPVQQMLTDYILGDLVFV